MTQTDLVSYERADEKAYQATIRLEKAEVPPAAVTLSSAGPNGRRGEQRAGGRARLLDEPQGCV